MAVHRVPRGTFTPDNLCTMTDAQYASRTDIGPTISEAYRNLGRISNPTRAACAHAAVHGIRSRISGPTKGDAPAVAYSRPIRQER